MLSKLLDFQSGVVADTTTAADKLGFVAAHSLEQGIAAHANELAEKN